MNRIRPIIARLVAQDEGQDLLEYGLLGVLVAVVAVTGVKTLGDTIRVVFWEVIGHGF